MVQYSHNTTWTSTHCCWNIQKHLQLIVVAALAPLFPQRSHQRCDNIVKAAKVSGWIYLTLVARWLDEEFDVRLITALTHHHYYCQVVVVIIIFSIIPNMIKNMIKTDADCENYDPP